MSSTPRIRTCAYAGRRGGDLFGGWRAGAATSREDDSAPDYTRYVYRRTPVLSIRVKPRKQAVEAGKVVRYRARDANTGNSTANGVRVCMKPKNADEALRPSTKMCKGVGELAPGAKATRVFKLEAKANAPAGGSSSSSLPAAPGSTPRPGRRS